MMGSDMIDLTQCPACPDRTGMPGRKSRSFALCKDCFEKYGEDREGWAPWLLFLVQDNDRIRYQNGHIWEHEVSVEDPNELNTRRTSVS